MLTKGKANEIYITREYNAPVDVVWRAWTDPVQAAQWWGPRGFTLTTHSKELRPGGIWHYTMHGPDGTDYPNKALYHEVEEFKKLVYDHGGNDEQAPLFRVTVYFSETDGKTTMDMAMTLPTAEEAAATRQFVKDAGGNATWDRLAEYLHETTEGRDCFVINRSFDVPVDRLFEMWVDPDHLAKWLPPAGFELKVINANIHMGGESFYLMTNNAGVTFYSRFEYVDIDAPHRMVYIQRFCDEDGKVTRHPGAPGFPEAMRTTVEFTPESDQSARVTVTTEPYGDANADEVAAFVAERSGMTLGWTGSFDKLESVLS